MRHIALLGFIFSIVFAFNLYASECRQIVASAHPEYPPYHWKSGKEIVGASVDITRQILSELNVRLEAKYFGPWKRVLSGAQDGRFDMVLALKKTKEREAFLKYTSSPIFPNPFAVFVHRTKQFKFNGWEDLTNYRGGKNAGDRYGDLFDAFATEHLKLQEAYTTEINVNKLIKGRIDYLIHGRYVGLAHFSTLGLGELIQPLDKNINEGFVHSGFTRDSKCQGVISYLSRRQAEMLLSGEAEEILQKNIRRWAEFSKNREKN